MDADRTGLGRDTRDRQLDFFTGSRDQVGKLIDDRNDIGQEPMPFLRIQATGNKFLIVFLYITRRSLHKQLITVLHLDHQ